ncbi:MAG: amidohydrolase family protein [Hyphomicrobiaceae bacterium]
MMTRLLRLLGLLVIGAAFIVSDVNAEGARQQTLFTNVHVFDGVNADRIENASVLVVGNLIKIVSTDPFKAEGATHIDGGGRTLMPGMIDGHAHLGIALPPPVHANNHWAYSGAAMVVEAEKMLMRGFTTVRDAGGPVYGLAKAIDEGMIPGPRIYPSGHFIGQTSGHGDFRGYNDAPLRDRDYRSFFEREWSFIADGKADVRAYAREALRLGATQLKLMAGGGASSPWDPLDTTQYSVEEMRAAVEAAEDWGTYVMVHVYHDRAVMRALEAGVKSIDHGAMIENDETMIAIKEAGAIFNPQTFIFSPPEELVAVGDPAAYAKGAPLREGLGRSMELAKKHGVKIAFGVDIFGSPEMHAFQNRELVHRLPWFTPAEILKQATSNTAELIAMSGPRNPYQDGPLGVIQEGAYADILLVDGNPLENIEVLTDPANNIDLIMKNGVVFKNQL